MNSRTGLIVGSVLVAAVLSPIASAERPPGKGGNQTPSYVGVALGTLEGDRQSFAAGVSSAGAVAGMSVGNDGKTRAFYRDPDGVMHDLTTSGSTGAAHGIAAGAGTEYVVGYEQESVAAAVQHAVIWIAPPAGTPAIILDTEWSEAHGVSAAGTVVGSVGNRAAIWTYNGNSYVRSLVPLADGDSAAGALAVNDAGMVIGYGWRNGAYSSLAFAYIANQQPVRLDPLAGDAESQAFAISNPVEVDGTSVVYVSGMSGPSGLPYAASRSVRWTVRASDAYVLEAVELDQVQGMGVNDAGDVAGTKYSRSRQQATLWRSLTNSYLSLKPPKGGTGSASTGMSRPSGPVSYVIGSTTIGGWPIAVRWVVE